MSIGKAPAHELGLAEFQIRAVSSQGHSDRSSGIRQKAFLLRWTSSANECEMTYDWDGRRTRLINRLRVGVAVAFIALAVSAPLVVALAGDW